MTVPDWIRYLTQSLRKWNMGFHSSSAFPGWNFLAIPGVVDRRQPAFRSLQLIMLTEFPARGTYQYEHEVPHSKWTEG